MMSGCGMISGCDALTSAFTLAPPTVLILKR